MSIESAGPLGFHGKIERNVTLLLVLSLLVVIVGGIVYRTYRAWWPW
mgnify:CR=1 FL=1